ncbi:Rhodopsin domain-containing protein [Madurella fahalii]|uniref:Rhodopsin domain-containing protein n=1 Tax=Madurella fahalii TaxID=1157608 RepID=A0ABQ0GGY6_9PEZI
MGLLPQSDLTPPDALDHSDRGPLFLALSWSLTALAGLFLALRLYCKLSTGRRLWWDDWVLIASLSVIIVNDVLTTVLVKEFGLGRHSWDMTPGDPVRFLLLLSSRATVTISAVVWTKTAFAVTLLRLTDGTMRRFVWFIIVSLSVTMGFSAAVPWIQCAPLAKGWDSSIPGTCWAPGVGVNIWIATGAYSAGMDFTLAALPWKFLVILRMRRLEKIGVGIAMSMGVIAGVVAVVKCFKLPRLNSPDAYEATELFMWDIAESTATMMAACIPSLRVLIQRVRGNSADHQTSNLTYITAPALTSSSVRRNPVSDSTRALQGDIEPRLENDGNTILPWFVRWHSSTSGR